MLAPSAAFPTWIHCTVAAFVSSVSPTASFALWLQFFGISRITKDSIQSHTAAPAPTKNKDTKNKEQKMAASAPPKVGMPLAVKPAKAVVLYGTETGNAEDQANKLANDLKGKGVNAQCIALDDYPFEVCDCTCLFYLVFGIARVFCWPNLFGCISLAACVFACVYTLFDFFGRVFHFLLQANKFNRFVVDMVLSR